MANPSNNHPLFPATVSRTNYSAAAPKQTTVAKTNYSAAQQIHVIAPPTIHSSSVAPKGGFPRVIKAPANPILVTPQPYAPTGHLPPPTAHQYSSVQPTKPSDPKARVMFPAAQERK